MRLSVRTHTAFTLWLLVLLVAAPLTSGAQEPTLSDPSTPRAAQVLQAPVILDGEELFRVRGTSALPAKQRASVLQERLAAAARDRSFDPGKIEFRSSDFGIELWHGDQALMIVTEADARVEGIETKALAETIRTRIASAIGEYRAARSGAGIFQSVVYAVGATLVFALFIAALVFATRVSSRIIDRYLTRYGHRFERRTRDLIERQHIWRTLQITVKVLCIALGTVALYYYVSTVLLSLPWTRGIAFAAMDLITSPLIEIGTALAAALPDVIALVIIFFLARLVLGLVRRFFQQVGSGRIKLSDFDPSWVQPTERLARFVIIVFALVMAYPYIPGSQTDAFKGISIFVGVILSLGSTSFIANIVAGYSLIYRRAFRIGDRIMIGGIIGDVVDIRLLATHVVTPKNERISFPNSQVLSAEVTNFSALAASDGLILHTEVGIGYEVPWRQVEALLLKAADRTPGVLKSPVPFVLQKRLGDFAPLYELNVYTTDEKAMPVTYSALHASIQDAFADAGVQIMTPNYVADPATDKVPPRAA